MSAGTFTATDARPRSSELPSPSLIFVTPNGFCKNRKIAIDLALGAVQGDVSLLQIRDRCAAAKEILGTTQALLAAGIPPRKISVNGLDPKDVGSVCTELGVHVREADIHRYVTVARNALSPGALVSCSAHSVESVRYALKLGEPSFIQVGTMFQTQSHPNKIPEGPQLLRDIRSAVGSSQPLIGIGGINRQNIKVVFEHGADGVAVISAISSSKHPREAASDLLAVCQGFWQAP